MTRAMSSLRASSMALSDSTRASASDCWRPFSTMPARRSATALSWATSEGLKTRGRSVWTLSTPTVWSCQDRGTLSMEVTKRRWSRPRTHRKRGSALTSRDHQRLAMGRDVAGHALAERDPRPADLEPVEAVRRGQRQVRSVPVEQVERGDIGMEGVARPVDDRLEQLVPGARGGRQAGDIVDEAQLIELVGRGQVVPAPSRPPGAVACRIRTRAGRARRAPAGVRRARSSDRLPSSSRYKGRKGCGRERLRSCPR